MNILPRIVKTGGLRLRVPAATAHPGTFHHVELFFPHDQANPGNLAMWDGCHGEAALGYYRERTAAPRTLAERLACQMAVDSYRRFLASIPEGPQTLVVLDRLPRGWRAHAWGRHA